MGPFEARDQRTQIGGYGVADTFGAYLEVGVDQAVSRSDDIPPGNLVPFAPGLGTDLRRSLADDLDALDQSESEEPVSRQIRDRPS